MKKEELIHLHLLLTKVKKFCEEQGLNCDFSMYNEMKISPLQVYRSKEEHMQAVFVLASELSSMAAKPILRTSQHTLNSTLGDFGMGNTWVF